MLQKTHFGLFDSLEVNILLVLHASSFTFLQCTNKFGILFLFCTINFASLNRN